MADEREHNPFTPAQQKALDALVTHPTIRQAAQAAEVSERSIYRWLHEPLFAAEVRGLRSFATQQALGKLQSASGAAAVTLLGLLGTTSPPAVRLAAARTVLEMSTKAVEIAELQARIEALEQAQEAARAANAR